MSDEKKGIEGLEEKRKLIRNDDVDSFVDSFNLSKEEKEEMEKKFTILFEDDEDDLESMEAFEDKYNVEFALNNYNWKKLLSLYYILREREEEQKYLVDNDNFNYFLQSNSNTITPRQLADKTREYEDISEFNNRINEIKNYWNIDISNNLSQTNKFLLLALTDLSKEKDNKREEKEGKEGKSLERQVTKFILTSNNFDVEKIFDNFITTKDKNYRTYLENIYKLLLSIVTNDNFSLYFEEFWPEITQIISLIFGEKYDYSDLTQYQIIQLYLICIVEMDMNKLPSFYSEVIGYIIHGIDAEFPKEFEIYFEQKFKEYEKNISIGKYQHHFGRFKDFVKSLLFYAYYKTRISEILEDKKIREEYFNLFKKMTKEIFENMLIDTKIAYSTNYDYENIIMSLEDILEKIFNNEWNVSYYIRNIFNIIRDEPPYRAPLINSLEELNTYIISVYYPKEESLTSFPITIGELYIKNGKKLLSLPEISSILTVQLKREVDIDKKERKQREMIYFLFENCIDDVFKELKINISKNDKFKMNKDEYGEISFKSGIEMKFEELLYRYYIDKMWIKYYTSKEDIIPLFITTLSLFSAFIYTYYRTKYPGDNNYEYVYFSIIDKHISDFINLKYVNINVDEDINDFKKQFNEMTNSRRKKEQRKQESEKTKREMKLMIERLPKNIDNKLMDKFKYALKSLFSSTFSEQVKSDLVLKFIKELNNNNVMYLMKDKKWLKSVKYFPHFMIYNDKSLCKYTIYQLYLDILNLSFPELTFTFEEIHKIFNKSKDKFSIELILELYKETGYIFIAEGIYRQTVLGQCTNNTDPILMIEFENAKDTISIEIDERKGDKKTIYCYDRESLISFWNQELGSLIEGGPKDESGAFLYGDCKFDENDDYIPGTCSRFYRLPYPDYFISEDDKNKIENNSEFTFWKMIPNKTVRMGRYHGVGSVEGDKLIYKVLHPKKKYIGMRK